MDSGLHLWPVTWRYDTYTSLSTLAFNLLSHRHPEEEAAKGRGEDGTGGKKFRVFPSYRVGVLFLCFFVIEYYQWQPLGRKEERRETQAITDQKKTHNNSLVSLWHESKINTV